MLVLFFPGWGIPPHGTAKGTYVIFFCKSNYKMALATYLICLGKTGRSLHKQLEKEWIQQTSPNYYFKLSYFFFFFTCSSGIGSLFSMNMAGCLTGTVVRCRLSQETSSLPLGGKKKRD